MANLVSELLAGISFSVTTDMDADDDDRLDEVIGTRQASCEREIGRVSANFW